MVEGEMVDRVIKEGVRVEGDLVDDEVNVGCDEIAVFGLASVITVSGGHSWHISKRAARLARICSSTVGPKTAP